MTKKKSAVLDLAPREFDAALVGSDIHTREDSAEVVFGQVFPGMLQICIDESIKRIFFLGDFWHLRYRVPVMLLNQVHAWLTKCADHGIHVTLLPGNHDQIDVAGQNALTVFNEMPNVTVHNEPNWTVDGLWVPYRSRIEDVQRAIALPPPSALLPKVCWIHYGVRGAMQNNHIADHNGVDPHLFKDFEAVYCGHYHKQQALGPAGKIVYIGSPYQTRADEAGDPKGVAIWRGGRDLERRQMEWGARYVKARVESVDDVANIPWGSNPAKDDHRITVAAGVDLQALSKSLESRGVTRYTLTPEVEAAEVRLQVAEDESVESYARAYMDMKVTDARERDPMWATFQRITEGKHDGQQS